MSKTGNASSSRVSGRKIDAVENWEEEIRALEAEGCRAVVACDFDSLAAMFSDQLVVNNPLNQVVGKSQVLDLMRSGRVRHASLKSDIEFIERSGDIVIVMGREAVVEPDGRSYARRYSNVWQREGGAWKLFARHANIIPA